MALSKLQLQRVCLQGQGHEECRYLDGDDHNHAKYYCKKKSPTEKKIIDESVADFLKEKKQKGEDPLDEYPPVPLGTGGGCQGFVVLKTKLQGYDV